MWKSQKVSALINAYIELAQRENYDDAQIIDALTDIFYQHELEELGFENFVRNYFEDKD